MKKSISKWVTRGFAAIGIIAVLLFGFVACKGPSGETASSQATEGVTQILNELYASVGIPEITNYQEYKFAKYLMELRDERITTWTYTVDEQGRRHFVCKSVGFGLPYGVQLTPSEVPVWKKYDSSTDHDDYTVPQAEPNGLYVPENVQATWILCKDEDEPMGVSPRYSEPSLMVSNDSLEYAIYPQGRKPEDNIYE